MSNSDEMLRTQFLQYVMGRLPEPDRTRFEERLLEDQEFSDAVAVCEQELIDDYAQRRLNDEETGTTGLWIEASPERVERVAIAQALLRRAPSGSSRTKYLGVAMGIAACLLAAAALYLVNANLPHRQQQNQATATVTKQPDTASNAPDHVAEQINTAKLDVILIAAERVRGEQTATVYHVHRARPVELQVLLPGEGDRSGYLVRIVNQANPSRIVLQQDHLEAQTMSGQLYLTLKIPAGSLPPATYLATVTRKDETLLSSFTVASLPE